MNDLSLAVQQQIIEEFKTNKDVFSQVYDFYFDLLFKFLLKRTLSTEVAYDVAAETFFKAFKNFERYRWQGISLKAWLFRIALNELNNHFRQPRVSLFGDPAEVESHHPLADLEEDFEQFKDALDHDPDLYKLSQAIARLGPKYQHVISLYYFTGLSQKEIANTVHKSPGAVKAMLHRAMTQLRTLVLNSDL